MWSGIRQGTRVSCNDKCLLVYNGDSYPGKIENISMSGVLLRFETAIPVRISRGDRCGLFLCRDPNICPGEYPVKVARIETSKVALQFFEI